MDLNELGDSLNALHNKVDKLLGRAEPAPPVSAVPRLMGPGVVRFGDAQFAVVEPIAVDWEPPLQSGVVAGQGAQGYEPSNGKTGSNDFPRRSVSGYPWHYGIGLDGEPTGKGRIQWGDQTFANEAELFANREAAAQSRANLQRYADWLNATPIDGRSNIRAADLNEYGLAVMRHFDEHARFMLAQARKPAPETFRALLDGSHREINEAIKNSYDNKEARAIDQRWNLNPVERAAHIAQHYNELARAFHEWLADALA